MTKPQRVPRNTESRGDGAAVITARKGEKVASVIARDIVRNIVRRDLKPGAPLELESQMLEHYNVSRASLREALRILEIQGIVVIKPGPGGGTFVADADSADFARMSTVFYHVMRVNFGAVMEARLIIEPVIASLAASRGDQELNDHLMRVVDDHDTAADYGDWMESTADFHATVCRMSGNPLLDLLAESLKNVYTSRVTSSIVLPRERKGVARVHREIAEAIQANDGETAQRLMHDHMQNLANLMDKRNPGLMQELVDWR